MILTDDKINASKYSFAQAVEDGVLIDVSDLAAQAGFSCPVYISSAFFNSFEIRESKLRVLGILEESTYDLRRDVEQKRFGTRIYNVCNPAKCPWGVSMKATLEPSREFGVVVFIIEREGELLDFSIPRTSAGGSFYVV